MRVFRNQTFSRSIYGKGRVYSDVAFEECYFEGCSFSTTTRWPRCRNTIRNARFVKCSMRGCGIGPAIIEDVVVDGLNTHGQVLFAWAAVYQHVVLKGRIGPIKLQRYVGIPGMEKPRLQARFDDANDAYYGTVDWALDISEGEFVDLCILNVPARLIRRDPATQIIITRTKATGVDWKGLGLQDPLLWETFVGMVFLEESREDDIVVVPYHKCHPRYEAYFHDIRVLREAGIAEPD